MADLLEWQLDQTPPTRVPDLDPMRTWLSIDLARRTGKSMALSVHTLNGLGKSFQRFTLIPSPTGKPKPVVKEKRPYENDRPTNLVYPTSYESWFNEYDQPLCGSQLRQKKSRQRHRR